MGAPDKRCSIQVACVCPLLSYASARRSDCALSVLLLPEGSNLVLMRCRDVVLAPRPARELVTRAPFGSGECINMWKNPMWLRLDARQVGVAVEGGSLRSVC